MSSTLNHNQTTILGRLSHEITPADVAKTESGTTVVRFRLAAARAVERRDGTAQIKTHFLPVAAYGALADQVIRHAHKGDHLFVQGHQENLPAAPGEPTCAETVADTIQFVPRQSGDTPMQ